MKTKNTHNHTSTHTHAHTDTHIAHTQDTQNKNLSSVVGGLWGRRSWWVNFRLLVVGVVTLAYAAKGTRADPSILRQVTKGLSLLGFGFGFGFGFLERAVWADVN